MDQNQHPEGASPKARGRGEFRLYRRALLVLYVATWVAFGGLALVSVVYELFFDTPAANGAAPPKQPADQLACLAGVEALLLDLETTSSAIQAQAADAPQQKLAASWEEFSAVWNGKWHQLNRRCRFEELAETGLGPAYDRMAWVHLSLPTVHLKYSALLKRFTLEQSDDLRQMTAALSRSRELLLSQKKE